jgi:hypothetical protein
MRTVPAVYAPLIDADQEARRPRRLWFLRNTSYEGVDYGPGLPAGDNAIVDATWARQFLASGRASDMPPEQLAEKAKLAAGVLKLLLPREELRVFEKHLTAMVDENRRRHGRPPLPATARRNAEEPASSSAKRRPRKREHRSPEAAGGYYQAWYEGTQRGLTTLNAREPQRAIGWQCAIAPAIQKRFELTTAEIVDSWPEPRDGKPYWQRGQEEARSNGDD